MTGDGGEGALQEPRCATCGDARYVRVERPLGHPDFGRALPCPDCRDLWHDDAALFDRLARIPALVAEASVERWRADINQEALTVAVAYAADWPPSHPFLVLVGSTTGTGKTYTAVAVMRAVWRRHRVWSRFWVVPNLLDGWRDTYGAPRSDDGRSASQIFRDRIRDVPLLVLDDFGAEAETDWANQQLYTLINDRYLERRPTILTTNVSADLLAERLPRLASRLRDRTLSTVVHFAGADLRRDPAGGEPPYWAR